MIVLLGLVLGGVALLLVEGSASMVLAVRSANRMLRMLEESHSHYDAELGWSHRPNLRIRDLYGANTIFTTNAQALRGTTDLTPAIPDGRYRVTCLGDSFTMGYGVSDAETFPARLESLHDKLQVVNMGQGGYGLDQLYLWYRRDGVKLQSNVLLFCVIPHDFYRMESDSFIGYAKPVLTVTGDRVEPRNVPVPRTWGTRGVKRWTHTFVESFSSTRLVRWANGTLGNETKFYDETRPTTREIARAVLKDMQRLSRERGQQFVIAYLPTADQLPHEPTRELTWLRTVTAELGIAFIDLSADFGRLPPWKIGPLYRADGHYTVEGNRTVAEFLLRELQAQIRDFPR